MISFIVVITMARIMIREVIEQLNQQNASNDNNCSKDCIKLLCVINNSNNLIMVSMIAIAG